MYPNDFLAQDIKNIKQDADRLKNELTKIPELKQIYNFLKKAKDPMAKDLEKFPSRAKEILDRLQKILGSIKTNSPSEDEYIKVFSLILLTNQLHAEMDWLHAMLNYLQTRLASANNPFSQSLSIDDTEAVTNAIGKVENYLAPMLKRFTNEVWQIVPSLATPKEWSFKSKAGASLLDLANIELEIKFG